MYQSWFIIRYLLVDVCFCNFSVSCTKPWAPCEQRPCLICRPLSPSDLEKHWKGGHPSSPAGTEVQMGPCFPLSSPIHTVGFKKYLLLWLVSDTLLFFIAYIDSIKHFIFFYDHFSENFKVFDGIYMSKNTWVFYILTDRDLLSSSPSLDSVWWLLFSFPF